MVGCQIMSVFPLIAVHAGFLDELKREKKKEREKRCKKEAIKSQGHHSSPLL